MPEMSDLKMYKMAELQHRYLVQVVAVAVE
jgi:hypothetical protein